MSPPPGRRGLAAALRVAEALEDPAFRAAVGAAAEGQAAGDPGELDAPTPLVLARLARDGVPGASAALAARGLAGRLARLRVRVEPVDRGLRWALRRVFGALGTALLYATWPVFGLYRRPRPPSGWTPPPPADPRRPW